MLAIDKITYVTSMDAEHKKKRLGRITASMCSRLISDKSDQGIFSKGAMTYINHLAYERINGESAKLDFSSGYTDRGNAMELEGIGFFCQQTGLSILRDTTNHDTHRFIEYDDYTACTPDALVCLAPLDKLFDSGKKKIKVCPLEIKCPLPNFVKFYQCVTPADVKVAEKVYYWQVLHQMLCCDSLNAYFAIYHPSFNGMPCIRIIEFKQTELVSDFRILKKTIEEAKKKIIKTIDLLKTS